MYHLTCILLHVGSELNTRSENKRKIEKIGGVKFKVIGMPVECVREFNLIYVM